MLTHHRLYRVKIFAHHAAQYVGGNQLQNLFPVGVSAGGSEVALSYDVILTLLRDGEAIAWPAGAEAQIRDKTGTVIATSATGVFENLGTMSPGDPDVMMRAYVKANEATVGGPYTLEVSVRFEQTD